MDILGRSWQNLGKILKQSWLRSCHGIHFVMVRSYQENHVPKKKFTVKSYLTRQNLKRSQRKSTSMQIYIDRHDNFLLPWCQI